ncbi:MRG-domain-containing protein [Fomes fomentarius]|nr:MRG-domain-containing protein [Fomes fomentarius]
MAAQSFAVGERVLCYHGALIYEAKVLKAEVWDEKNTQSGVTGAHFYVHYKGWKQTWDEWAHVTRLLKFNETNIALQKALQSQYQEGRRTGHETRTGGGESARVARVALQGEGTRKPEMKLNAPEPLKVLLVDDWEAVTKNNQLVGLPRKPNVVELLEEFKQYVLSQASSTQLKDPQVLLPTIVAGLQTYFDRALGANLLYRFERPQYAEVRKRYVNGPTVQVGQEKEMSAIYGAEHFLRMLVSLPQMVASSSMDSESVGLLRDYANELLQWMVKERHRIFVPEYKGASIVSQ